MLARAVSLSRIVISVTDHGAVGDGSTDDTTAINNAITAAAAGSGKLIFPDGVYRTTSTITFNADFLVVKFLGGAEIRPDAAVLEGVIMGGTGIAESMYIERLFVNRVSFSTATENIGIKYLECSRCTFDSVHSRQSKYNHKFIPTTAGISYNVFINLFGNQGLRNIWIVPGGTGWFNENVFIGGRMLDSGNTDIHVYIDNTTASDNVNGNKFYGVSTETAHAQMSYAWYLDRADNNLIHHPRTEGAFVGGDIILKANTTRNEIVTARPDLTIIDESLSDTNFYRTTGFGRKFVTTSNQLLNTRSIRQGANSTTPTDGIAITGATQADPVVITSTAHGLSNGDDIFIRKVGGMEEINYRVFEIANVAANTYELLGVDGSAYTAYTSGGYAMPGVPHTTIEDVYSNSGNSQALDIYYGRQGTSSYGWRIIKDSDGSVTSFLTNDGDMRLGKTLSLLERSSAISDTAGYGQIWVKTATPNQLWFTNDAGTDVQLGISGASDHGALTGLGDDDHTQYILANGTRAFSGNQSFGGFQAENLAWHNGATLPSSPTEGQQFLHTPTGRKILYTYDGTAAEWSPIKSIGDMTIYVDNTDGTDSLDKGTGVDSAAFKTVQFAIDTIPGQFGGNVVININAETYSEQLAIKGKYPAGSFTITLLGTLSEEESISSATVSAGTGSTQGTVTKTGEFTGDAYSNFLVYFVTDDIYRVIDSHTNDALTLVGTAASSTTQDIVVYSWGTVIDSGSTNRTILLDSGQIGVRLEKLKVTVDSGKEVVRAEFGVDSLFNSECWFNGSIQASFGGSFFSSQSYHSAASGSRALSGNGRLFLSRSKANNIGTTTAGIVANFNGFVALRFGTIIDGFTTGINAKGGSIINHNTNFASGYVRIRNNTTGVLADGGGKVTDTSTFVYSGNTTDESPSGASDPAYID